MPRASFYWLRASQTALVGCGRVLSASLLYHCFWHVSSVVVSPSILSMTFSCSLSGVKWSAVVPCKSIVGMVGGCVVVRIVCYVEYYIIQDNDRNQKV